MWKKLFLALVTGLFIFSCVHLVAAAGKSNPKKGKYLFRKTCRMCHKEGVSGDRMGKPLSPVSKTQAEWKAVFGVYEKLACKDVWEKLSDRDLQDIFAHLYGHASDSPSPAKCQ